ncbi:MAG: cyclic nucleotide-binding domain-containing protein [Betaproteobacteria bacterium]
MKEFDIQAFNEGEMIFEIGDVASHLFFIQSGAVELINAQGLVFGEVPKGQSFGEAAILAGGIRSASIRAKGPVVCTRIAADIAAQLLNAHSPLLVTILEALLLQQSMQNSLRHPQDVRVLDAP